MAFVNIMYVKLRHVSEMFACDNKAYGFQPCRQCCFSSSSYALSNIYHWLAVQETILWVAVLLCFCISLDKQNVDTFQTFRIMRTEVRRCSCSFSMQSLQFLSGAPKPCALHTELRGWKLSQGSHNGTICTDNNRALFQIRQRSLESKGDRYMLLTFEDHPHHIKVNNGLFMKMWNTVQFL